MPSAGLLPHERLLVNASKYVEGSYLEVSHRGGDISLIPPCSFCMENRELVKYTGGGGYWMK
jgi:hypothetical protein